MTRVTRVAPAFLLRQDFSNQLLVNGIRAQVRVKHARRAAIARTALAQILASACAALSVNSKHAPARGALRVNCVNSAPQVGSAPAVVAIRAVWRCRVPLGASKARLDLTAVLRVNRAARTRSASHVGLQRVGTAQRVQAASSRSLPASQSASIASLVRSAWAARRRPVAWESSATTLEPPRARLAQRADLEIRQALSMLPARVRAKLAIYALRGRGSPRPRYAALQSNSALRGAQARLLLLRATSALVGMSGRARTSDYALQGSFARAGCAHHAQGVPFVLHAAPRRCLVALQAGSARPRLLCVSRLGPGIIPLLGLMSTTSSSRNDAPRVRRAQMAPAASARQAHTSRGREPQTAVNAPAARSATWKGKRVACAPARVRSATIAR